MSEQIQNDLFGATCKCRSSTSCGDGEGSTCTCYRLHNHEGSHQCPRCDMTFQTQTEGLREGTRLRDEGIERVSEYRRNWVADCKKAMFRLYEARQRTSIIDLYVNGDDATGWLDREGYEGDNRLVGAVFKSGWEQIGMVKSRLPKRHVRPIACWKPRLEES